jgi:hypothetical protein
MQKSISLQFHALPDEAFRFLISSIAAENMYISIFNSQTKSFYRQASPNELHNCEIQINSIVLTLSQPLLEHNSIYDFLGDNPDAMVLDIGALKANSLSESWLSAKSAHADIMTVWKRLVTRFKKNLKNGGIVVNPESGVTSNVKNQHYSSGAKSFSQSGGTLSLISRVNYFVPEM